MMTLAQNKNKQRINEDRLVRIYKTKKSSDHEDERATKCSKSENRHQQNNIQQDTSLYWKKQKKNKEKKKHY